MASSVLPHVNAALNAACALLLVNGYRLIRAGNAAGHRKSMLAALAVSLLFFLSYGVYHFNVGSVKFQGTGAVRTVYFAVLVSHTVLAVMNLPLVAVVVRRAWRGQLAQHQRLARRVLPLWLYVSVSGVIVYWMLYRM